METNVGSKISFYRQRKNMMQESEVIFDDDFRGYSKIQDGNDDDKGAMKSIVIGIIVAILSRIIIVLAI